MSLSRRQLFKYIGVGGAGVAAVALGPRAWRSLRARPASPPKPAAPLAEVLLAVAQTVVRSPIETTHYLDYFGWRADHLPEYAALYRKLADDLEAASAGRSFAACDLETKKRIVEKLTATTEADGDEVPPLSAGLGSRALQYRRYVVGEIYALFAATDAWVSIGYESWIGVPPGASYHDPPPGILNPAIVELKAPR